MTPRCSHIFLASLCLVSPETTSSCAITTSASWSGGGGPSAPTPWVDQQPADCAGYWIVWCWCIVPLTIWYLGTGSMVGPPSSPVSAPGRRDGGMRQWAGCVFGRWWSRSSPRLARGITLTLRSSPGVGSGWPVPPPLVRHHTPPWSSVGTPRCIPACCNNNLGWWSWSPSESLGWGRQSLPPGCPKRAWSYGRGGC